MFADKVVAILGGTGSLGNAIIDSLLKRPVDVPRRILVFSRDETKQHAMRLRYLGLGRTTDECAYRNCERLLEFRIGDIRNLHSVCAVLSQADIVFHAAAMKQVPTCEYFPFEAVETNVIGAQNLVRAIRDHGCRVETVVGISTDKACKPVSTMGLTKALQERILIQANFECRETRFICVRYGNVLGSRGSVIPLFQEQIADGGPVTITTDKMTRFLLTLEQAVKVVLDAVQFAQRGETYVPRIAASRIGDIVDAMINKRDIEIVATGIRPGEKTHEVLVSEEELSRTVTRGDYYVIKPILPELRDGDTPLCALGTEYCSADHLLSPVEVASLLKREKFVQGGEK